MPDLTFSPLQTLSEAETCARMMADSEPLTWRRSYKGLLKAVHNPRSMEFLAKSGAAIYKTKDPLSGYQPAIQEQVR